MSVGDDRRRLAVLVLGLIGPLAVMSIAGSSPARKKVAVRPALKVEERPAFYVVGLARRTNNAREMAGAGEIGKVWQEFLQKHLESGITGKLDNDLLAVYTDYENGQNGDYTYLLGKRVSEIRSVPAGLTGRYVPAGRYAELVSENGSAMEVVPKMWQRVWSMSAPALGGRRVFEADYELYSERGVEGGNGQVSLYIGVE